MSTTTTLVGNDYTVYSSTCCGVAMYKIKRNRKEDARRESFCWEEFTLLTFAIHTKSHYSTAVWLSWFSVMLYAPC